MSFDEFMGSLGLADDTPQNEPEPQPQHKEEENRDNPQILVPASEVEEATEEQSDNSDPVDGRTILIKVAKSRETSSTVVFENDWEDLKNKTDEVQYRIYRPKDKDDIKRVIFEFED